MNAFLSRASLLALLAAAALGGCSAPGGPGAAFDGVAVPDPPEISPEMRTAASDLDSFAWFQDFPEDTARAAAARPGAVAGRFAFAANVGIPLVTPEAYPDADEVSLFEWESTRYATNGTYTTTWTSLSKILTQRGLEKNRTYSFSNDDFYGSTTVLVARIHTPGAPPRDVDLASNLAEAIDTGSLASNIHDPNEKTFTLAFPGLQVGDAVELVMRRTAKRPRCEGVYADYLTFESDHPILFQGARIEGPASMPLRSRAFRDAGPVRLGHAAVTNEAAGTIAEAWVAEDETPRFFAEPHMPPAYDCTARLLLSTAPDWESLSRWYARLCAPHLAATNDAMRAKVDELLRTALSAPPAAGSDSLLDDSRAKSAEVEAADRRAFRELNPEFRLDELDELWCWIVDFRLQEAKLRREVLRLWGEVLGPGETVEKAERDVREATDAAPRDEGNSLSNRLEALPESERDSFLEDVWVERRAESRRLQGAIVDLKQRLEVFVVEADPHEEAAEGADDGGASSPSEPQDRAPRDRAPRADDRTPAERASVVRALFDFVSREVRYMGAMAESEAPGYEPHDVSLTFDNRYGVCRDKAALLVAMLRMAGIDAWPVLINVGPRKDPDVPQPYFNHAIVAADSGDPDDPYLLMDPTSETTRSLLPEYLCEMSYLVARDEGETIRETPPLPVEENLLRAETIYTLHADASADVTTTLSFAGVNDAAYRGYFASIPRDGLRAFLERVLQGIPGAVLTGWEVRPAPEELRTSPEPLSVRIDYAIAEAARGADGGRAALLDLPTVPAALAIASRVVGDLGLEKRRFPLDTDYPCGWEETVEIRLPEGVEAVPPPSVAFPGE